MPKDTKSSGYNKAPACESRGFGHKKEGENFDTPSWNKSFPCMKLSFPAGETSLSSYFRPAASKICSMASPSPATFLPPAVAK